MIHYITGNGIGNPWVVNELSALEKAGVPFTLHTMRRPDVLLHGSEWALKLNEGARVIYPLPVVAFAVSVLLAPFLYRGRFFAALWNAMFGEREHLRARAAGLAHLLVACHWVRGLRASGHGVTHIHSQWISSCGTIGMYGAWLSGVGFSFTGHAADLFRERCSLADKIRRAEFIVCISEFHREFYLKNGARPEQLFVVYCGIRQDWFYPRKEARAAGSRYRVLSTGRLIEKKGFEYLIDACAILRDRGEDFECVIGGSGPLEQSLKERVRAGRLEDRVTVTGEAILQEDLVGFMHGGDVYALACVWAKDNDVDGLPQMLMEAMACGLPAISTRLVGIPDLVRDGETGLLVEPNDAAGLADAIVRMKGDREMAGRLAEAGRKWVAERFNLETCVEPLIRRYRAKMSAGPAMVSAGGERAAV